MSAEEHWLKGHGPWQRDVEHRLVGGVASGIAARTSVDVQYVRLAFIIAALLGGFGVAAYVVAWLLVPATDEPTTIGSRALNDKQGVALAAGLGALLVAVLVVVSFAGAGWIGSLAWPLVISVAGIVVLIRNASPAEQATLRSLVEPLLGFTGDTTRGMTVMRVSIALVLLAGGLALLLVGHAQAALLLPLAGVTLVVAAVLVVLGPWWLGITRDLVTERQARARAEERADMAARVHDSVLQTLALIQRHADDPQQVIQLARAQERELRSWLFDGRPPGSLGDESTTLAAGIRLIQSEVEAQHHVSVETVIVGDCALDNGLIALLGAAREATVNAAKWSGAAAVSVFCEVEPAGVTLFVRDRGRGFDPATVPADRKGLAESIRGRVTRHGGTAAIRSVPGEGTEIGLTMPRSTTAVEQAAR
ncbi:MAG TPA: PspC domain-containing protein [Candidatus Acidoferrales bacterium]|nr:PspC domain-containing protein [Candidatus Acidoferrales bacterium]